MYPNPDKPEITNHKHQISNKVLMKKSFSIRLPFFKIIYWFVFWDFGHWYLLVI
jgi:hypothetical protein